MPLDAQGDGAGQVSVVIPTHNRAALLRETLRSVAGQDEPVAEVIVADDGSTDDTAALLDEFGAVHVRNPAGGWGPARARNAGLERVRTEYVAFVDSDDLWLPSAARVLRGALEANPHAPFAFGRGLSAIRTPSGWEQDGLIGMSHAEHANVRAALFVRNSVPSPARSFAPPRPGRSAATTRGSSGRRITISGSGWPSTLSRLPWRSSSVSTGAIPGTATRRRSGRATECRCCASRMAMPNSRRVWPSASEWSSARSS